MVHKAIDIADPGDVIVVDGGGDLTNSLIGELMSAYAESRGIAGIVIYGAIRDYNTLSQLDWVVGQTPAERDVVVLTVRLIRGQVLFLRERLFIEAARAIGGHDSWIIREHILANAIGPHLVRGLG